MMIALKILAGLAAFMLIIGVCYLGHRFLVKLEDRGYIYYRNKAPGSSGGVFFELDKLTRPSIEHVERARDVKVESLKHDGE